MSQKNISVITVTLNNAAGLRRTLQSLASIETKPLEVLVMDGGSLDDTAEVVREFVNYLSIRFYSGRDKGIYDAMNIGRERSIGNLVHYLNAGDVVWGDPYKCLNDKDACILPVNITSESGEVLWKDRPKLFGYAYCHQGVVLSRNHPDYDLSLSLSADLDVLMQVFPRGLYGEQMSQSGGVSFFLGGVSSVRTRESDLQVCQVFKRRSSFVKFSLVWLLVKLKRYFPKSIRQLLARFFFGRGSQH